MRRIIKSVLDRTPDISVVGEAQDPLEAREAIKALNPDVVTLDIEMPRMNGLEFLEKIMRLRPTPVIMVSSLTVSGAETTIRALEIGAVDCVAKPEAGERDLFHSLPDKIRAAAKTKVGSLADRLRDRADDRPTAPNKTFRTDGSVLAIGSSTGGVEALTAILSCFPANCPPTVITQHMPPLFTRSFAERLNRLCAPTVAEASDGAQLLDGHVYIAPGSLTHHLEVVGTGRLRCRLRQAEAVNGHCPSVDVLFHSVAKAAGAGAVGIILTGMGRDGAAGLLAMRQAGARTLGQDAASSLVYGMPKVAHEVGAVERQVPLRRMGNEILQLTNTATDTPPCLSPQASK
ncbi:chemotaxis response regulator protein-glutamate methylesterase [Hyphomicrobiales bacterium BP6-180914]|uniref:Protein-glutamate methylesterase/protein-glutamine glutaminase n=2 Tax=Lichenifustis flavocetrariae TaxID=2949735 RepID=A0AA41YT42_9HYPH|nr:chemotaxis response regulator protein-glutamate methylesterase [Lichenifustis flavocetrariae]